MKKNNYNAIIDVTQQDINKGICMSEIDCPIGLALKRAGFKNRCVEHNITINGIRFTTPKVITKFIQKFDKTRKVKPFSFSIGLSGLKVIKGK